jgi:hypothetical protein
MNAIQCFAYGPLHTTAADAFAASSVLAVTDGTAGAAACSCLHCEDYHHTCTPHRTTQELLSAEQARAEEAASGLEVERANKAQLEMHLARVEAELGVLQERLGRGEFDPSTTKVQHTHKHTTASRTFSPCILFLRPHVLNPLHRSPPCTLSPLCLTRSSTWPTTPHNRLWRPAGRRA